jgi:hypothetical protein
MFVMLLSDSAAQNVFHDDRSPPSHYPLWPCSLHG